MQHFKKIFVKDFGDSDLITFYYFELLLFCMLAEVANTYVINVGLTPLPIPQLFCITAE